MRLFRHLIRKITKFPPFLKIHLPHRFSRLLIPILGACHRAMIAGSRISRSRALSIFEIVSIERFSVPFSTRDTYCWEQPILSATPLLCQPQFFHLVKHHHGYFLRKPQPGFISHPPFGLFAPFRWRRASMLLHSCHRFFFCLHCTLLNRSIVNLFRKDKYNLYIIQLLSCIFCSALKFFKPHHPSLYNKCLYRVSACSL